MLRLPNETLVGLAENDTANWQLIVQALRMGQLTEIPSPNSNRRYQVITPTKITPFYTEKVGPLDGRSIIVTDVRPFMTQEGVVRRTSSTDYSVRMIGSYLTARWLNPEDKVFLAELNFAGICFVSAVSLRVSHTYNLNGEQMLLLGIVLAQYWGQLVRRNEPYTQDSFQRDVIKYSGFNPNTTSSIRLDTIPLMETINLESLLATIQSVLATPKLVNLTLTSFLVIMKSLIFTYRQDKYIPYSLEFPPAFISLVYNAIIDRSMRKSYLSAAVEASSQRNKQAFETFNQWFKLNTGGTINV